MELVGGRDKGLARQLRYRLGHGRVKAFGGVEPGAHGGPTQGQLPQAGQRQLHHRPVLLQAGPPAADLLGEGDRSSILQMGTSCFYNAFIFSHQSCKSIG